MAFSRSLLIDAKRHAMRRGVWFRALDGLERGIINLVNVISDTIHSPVLVRLLENIIAKLTRAMKSGFARYLENHGWERTMAVVDSAKKIGYVLADGWLGEPKFTRYLIFLDYNQPMGWGMYSKT